MNTIVCVKPVPSNLIRTDKKVDNHLSINPYDVYSIKKEAEYKKKYGGKLVALSMGALASQSLLQRCLAMGCDEAILLSDPCFAGADTYATAKVLMKAVTKLEWERIVCGHTALDGETAQVYGELAASLGCICLSSVLECSVDDDGGQLIQYYDNGFVRTVRTKMPVVLSYLEYVTTDSISLMALKRARTKTIRIWDKDALGLEEWECGQKGSRTRVIRSTGMCQMESRKAQFHFGSMEEIADVLYREMVNYI